MNTITQVISLKSDGHYGKRPPAEPLGEVLRMLPIAVRQSVRMAFEGRSSARGVRPNWLEAASDVRFVGQEGNDDTRLYFESPPLGEAAASLYDQQVLWATRPDPKATGFDLLGDVICDVASHNADSERFDKQLLKRIGLFDHALNGTFQELTIASASAGCKSPPSLNPSVIRSAKELSRSTPRSQAVRLMGRLDMIRASTNSFALKLEDGNEVRGVLGDENIDQMVSLFRQNVLVLGKAVFRPSNRLLRVDASEIHPASDADRFFSKLPLSNGRTIALRESLRECRGGGIAAIFGKWPGDETDEEVEAALGGLS